MSVQASGRPVPAQYKGRTLWFNYKMCCLSKENFPMLGIPKQKLNEPFPPVLLQQPPNWSPNFHSASEESIFFTVIKANFFKSNYSLS